MYLNKYFNTQNLNLYIDHLKDTQRSDSSIKRKISSLSSFQKFLIRKKYLEPTNLQLSTRKAPNKKIVFDNDNLLNKIKNIFASPQVSPVENSKEE